MKIRVLLPVLLLFMLFKGYAQTRVETSEIFYQGSQVGIGISAPQQRLHVNGNIYVTANNSIGMNQADSFGKNGHAVGHYSLGWYMEGEEAKSYYTSFYGIKLFTAGVQRMEVSKLGNVGIGTNDDEPRARLDVRGGFLLGSDQQGSILLTGTGTAMDQRFLRLYQSPDLWAASGLMAGGMLVSDNYAYATPARGDLVVQGTVRIGTEKVQTGYQLAVNGKVRAKEVRVEANWPDFVFSPAYQLPTLPELEHYIKENQHLPEVPSAQEVAQEGIDVGRAQALLLKKVEELTLYLIAQDKKIKQLELELQQVKKGKGR